MQQSRIPGYTLQFCEGWRTNCSVYALFLVLFETSCLQRLAGSEEVVPTFDFQQLSTSAAKEIEDSVQTSLLKIEARDYNHVLQERGFHQKLNFLVKESLQFG